MRETLKYQFSLMLMSPVLGLWFVIKSGKLKSKKWPIVLFVTIFGSTMILAPESDSIRHQERVYTHYYSLPVGDFIEELGDILLLDPQEDTNDDVYIHVLSFLCGSILASPGLFFVFVSFVFGYFYASGILKVLKYVKLKNGNWVLWGFIMLFVLFNSIQNINTVRTWTGLWVLFNGVFGYFETGKRKYLILIAATPLIHIGYAAMALPALVVCVFKIRPVIYAVAFSVSFFAQLTPNSIIKQLSVTQVGASKVDAYYIDPESGIDRLEAKKGKANWYAYYGKQLTVIWGTTLLAITLLVSGAYFTHMLRLEKVLFSVGLLTIALANFNHFFYALYNRSYAIAGLFIITSVVLFLARKKYTSWTIFNRALFNVGISSSLAIYSVTFIYILSTVTQVLSTFMLGLPFLPWLAEGINLSLREFVGDLVGI